LISNASYSPSNSDSNFSFLSILGGHEHTPFYFTHSGTTIIKCGQNMDDLGILDLTFQKNSENNVKAEYLFKLLPTEDTDRDETVDSVIQKWTDTISEGAGGGDILCVIGDHCLSTLTSDLRTRETAFACMVADAIVYSYEDLGCQLGIQNGGFVRYGTVPGPIILYIFSPFM
jgi:2',3'-cyclic-nucleotide 2'-phosphodiesterase (5'-nucleotidase family)